MRKLIVLLAVFGIAFGANYENANKLVDGAYCGKTVSMTPCLYAQAFKQAISYERNGDIVKAQEVVRTAEVIEVYIERESVSSDGKETTTFVLDKRGNLQLTTTKIHSNNIVMDWNDWKVSYKAQYIKEV